MKEVHLLRYITSAILVQPHPTRAMGSGLVEVLKPCVGLHVSVNNEFHNNHFEQYD